MQNDNKQQSAEEAIKLISGRIIDEHRKHSPHTDEWPRIAAIKIHSQWFEYYNQQTQSLQKQVEEYKESYLKMSLSYADLVFELYELKEQLEVSQLEAKDNLDHANIIRQEYKELKKQVDELKEKNFLQLGRIQGLKDENKKFRFKSDCDDNKYTKLKEAADEMARLILLTCDVGATINSANKYKQLTNLKP